MLRVLSDLHLAHPASLIRNVSQIGPLLEGMQTVVFNGDTVELRMKKTESRALQCLEALRTACLGQGATPVFIHGNHDPDASAVGHLDLMEGRLLVTHGHALFPEITPWSREAKVLREQHASALGDLVDQGDLGVEDRLRAVKEACLRSPSGRTGIPETGLQWAAGALSEMAHPLRAWQVLRAWVRGPDLATAFVDQHCPQAQCLVMGHTHFPGFWKRGERLVINTGAYLPWFGRRIVDISEEEVRVRAVVRDGSNFRPGKVLLRWSPRMAGPVSEGPAVAVSRGEAGE